MSSTDDRPRLRDLGQVYVTSAAARQYASAAAEVYAEGKEIQIEEARRELTELLMEARRVESESGTHELWRFRRDSIGVDISARIVREKSSPGDAVMMVVVSISARAKTGRTGRRR